MGCDATKSDLSLRRELMQLFGNEPTKVKFSWANKSQNTEISKSRNLWARDRYRSDVTVAPDGDAVACDGLQLCDLGVPQPPPRSGEATPVSRLWLQPRTGEHQLDGQAAVDSLQGLRSAPGRRPRQRVGQEHCSSSCRPQSLRIGCRRVLQRKAGPASGLPPRGLQEHKPWPCCSNSHSRGHRASSLELGSKWSLRSLLQREVGLGRVVWFSQSS